MGCFFGEIRTHVGLRFLSRAEAPFNLAVQSAPQKNPKKPNSQISLKTNYFPILKGTQKGPEIRYSGPRVLDAMKFAHSNVGRANSKVGRAHSNVGRPFQSWGVAQKCQGASKTLGKSDVVQLWNGPEFQWAKISTLEWAKISTLEWAKKCV